MVHAGRRSRWADALFQQYNKHKNKAAVAMLSPLALLVTVVSCGGFLIWLLLAWVGGVSAAPPPPVTTSPTQQLLYDTLVAYEDSAASVLTPAAVTRSLAYQHDRDGVARFRRIMESRYKSSDGRAREEATGGVINLVKADVQPHSRDGVVQWRYLRNHRRLPGGPEPRQWSTWSTHPMEATRHYCSNNTAPSVPSDLPPVSSGTAAARDTPFSLVRRHVRINDASEEDFLDRPTVMCVSLLSQPSRLHMALHQYQLWGRYCDIFWLAVPLLPPEMTGDSDYDDGFSVDSAKDAAARVGLSMEHLKFVQPEVLLHLEDLMHDEAPDDAETGGTAETAARPTLDELRAVQRSRSRWQVFRELLRMIDSSSSAAFVDHFFFVDENSYVIPENLYALLSEPPVRLLHELGTPLWLGNRLLLPPMESQEGEQLWSILSPGQPLEAKEKVRDVSASKPAMLPYNYYGASFTINRVLLRVLVPHLSASSCLPTASLAAIDVALALCLRPLGVYPRDTMDAHGADRFLVHHIEHLARRSNDHPTIDASWVGMTSWVHKPRRLWPFHPPPLSAYTITFPLLHTIEDQSTLHAWVFLKGGTRELR